VDRDDFKKYEAEIAALAHHLEADISAAIQVGMPMPLIVDVLLAALASAASRLDDEAIDRWLDRAPIELGLLMRVNREVEARRKAADAIEAAKRPL
jgi:hypothetical protein